MFKNSDAKYSKTVAKSVRNTYNLGIAYQISKIRRLQEFFVPIEVKKVQSFVKLKVTGS